MASLWKLGKVTLKEEQLRLRNTIIILSKFWIDNKLQSNFGTNNTKLRVKSFIGCMVLILATCDCVPYAILTYHFLLHSLILANNSEFLVM